MTKPAIDALWALYIPGSEELYAQHSEAAANAAAQRHNDAIRSQVGEHFHPDAHAKAIIWPLDPASHAESLATGEAYIMSSNHLSVPDSLAGAVMDAALADTQESPALFDVDACAIPVLALFTNPEEVTINNILVMPHPDGDGVLLAATDRHHMATWHDPQGKKRGQTDDPGAGQRRDGNDCARRQNRDIKIHRFHQRHTQTFMLAHAKEKVCQMVIGQNFIKRNRACKDDIR